MHVGDLPTPCLLLERAVLEANLDRMAARASELGVRLRPHLKTAKSVAVAALARRGPVDGFTVSTLREAEHFAAAGERDLFYAVAIEPGKFERAAELLRAGVQLAVACDSEAVARGLSVAGSRRGVRFPVLVEINCGEHRSGLSPDDPRVTGIARVLHGGPGAELRGVFTHGGHSYAGRAAADHAAVAEEERAAAASAAARIRAMGLACPVVSLGSTPTAVHAAHLRGITELRCGVYMFGDLFQAGIGACRREDIALTVLTAVIGHRPERNALLVDAGALALSKDVSTRGLGPAGDAGYGLVADAGGAVIPGWRVTGVHQEHGQVTADAPIDPARYPAGTRLRILPNHACLTAAAHDGYHVVAGGSEVIAEWPRVNGW